VRSAVPHFSVETVGRTLQIAGAREGSAYAVLDMQGRVLRSGRVGESSFSIPVSQAGSYLVRVGLETRRVSVR
jgi:hypothetical protein